MSVTLRDLSRTMDELFSIPAEDYDDFGPGLCQILVYTTVLDTDIELYINDHHDYDESQLRDYLTQRGILNTYKYYAHIMTMWDTIAVEISDADDLALRDFLRKLEEHHSEHTEAITSLHKILD